MTKRQPATNLDIREALKKAGIPQWKLAEKVGYSAGHFIVKLRHELSNEDKAKLFIAIQELAEEERRNADE